MSIDKMCRLVGILCLVSLAVLIFCIVRVINGVDAVKSFEQKRFDSTLLAQEVRSTSSGLTASARAYVSTGDAAHEKIYWDLVKIRGGEIPRPHEAAVAPGQTTPMSVLLQNAGFTKEELGLLEESVAISAALVLLEDKAMHMVKGLFADATGKYTIKGDPDTITARQLMFGEEYEATIRKIMKPSFTFDKLVQERIARQNEAVESSLRVSIIGLCVAVGVIALVVLTAIVVLLKKVTAPIISNARYAQAIAEGDLDAAPPDYRFSEKNEIGQMINSMKTMVINLKTKIAEAEQKSREAEEQNQKAQAAMVEANAAKEKAEAGQLAILQAAEQVDQVVNRLSATAEELSTQVEQSSKSTDMQRDRVSQSATAMEEMNSTVREVARSAGVASEGSETARQKAFSGSEIVSRSMEALSRVEQKASVMNNEAQSLGQQAESIGQIMTVISDIADQTNLLALNAAIEAARAGDAGRGFAVVADEVRKLAEKTMTATKEVGDAISGIQQGTQHSIASMRDAAKDVEDATELARQSGKALKEIVVESEQVASQIQAIATAAEEQSAVSEEIASSLEEINSMAGGNAAAMQQSAQAVAELSQQAQALQALVSNLRSKDTK